MTHIKAFIIGGIAGIIGFTVAGWTGVGLVILGELAQLLALLSTDSL